MINLQVQVRDGDELVMSVSAALPDLWVAAELLRQLDDVVCNYAEKQEANKELQEN